MIETYDDVRWFVGVVEDRMDPLKQGRCRVRVYGLHPFEKVQGDISGIPTDDLPWMPTLQPSNSAAISGIGHSLTGIVEGTTVYGHWLDKYKTSGLIIGTCSAHRNTKPNYNEGFSDPTGQFPRSIGSDTNLLTIGGDIGASSSANVIQNNNIDTAINPDDTDLANIPEDNDPSYSITDMLRRDEGLSLKVYWDVRGYTVGIGHFIGEFAKGNMTAANSALSKQVGRTVTGNPGIITTDEAIKLFSQDRDKMLQDVKTNNKVGPVYAKVNKSRQMALENMSFQMGVGGLAKFGKMLDAMFIGDWKTAYREARNSVWFNQTKGRASRVSMIILTGNLESYGIPAPRPEGKSVGAMRADTNSNSNPEDSWTPTDSRILFKEPESSYKGQYPYVHTYESESGIIQEFDDTPGNERYRIVHPNGCYEEIAPDGRRTRKTINDLYDITNADANILVSGDKKVNVGGNEVYYNMYNRRQQIDGNNTLYIRGDESKTVEGNGTLYVKGNIKIVVEGNANIHVEQEAFVTVDKDTTVVCNQNAEVNVALNTTVNTKSMDFNVEDTFNINATDININATNTISSDAGVLNSVTGGNVQVGG